MRLNILTVHERIHQLVYEAIHRATYLRDSRRSKKATAATIKRAMALTTAPMKRWNGTNNAHHPKLQPDYEHRCLS